MSLRSVCVFCGSRSGRNPAHVVAARHTGEMLARNGWRLVFGAGDVGLMGEVAKAATAAGADAGGDPDASSGSGARGPRATWRGWSSPRTCTSARR